MGYRNNHGELLVITRGYRWFSLIFQYFPILTIYKWAIFHGYVSHNQSVSMSTGVEPRTNRGIGGFDVIQPFIQPGRRRKETKDWGHLSLWFKMMPEMWCLQHVKVPKMEVITVITRCLALFGHICWGCCLIGLKHRPLLVHSISENIGIRARTNGVKAMTISA